MLRFGVVLVLCVYMWCCAYVCTCGVWCWCCVCTCGACGVVCTCGVWCWWCVWWNVWCGVWWYLALGKLPVCTFNDASVCTVRTYPCVPATGPNVQDMRACCRYTRRRPDRTHGGVLNVHTGGFLFSLFSSVFLSLWNALSRSFLPLLFKCLVSLKKNLFLFFWTLTLFEFLPLFSLSWCLSAHTETRSDRPFFPPTKNGHAPRDPLNQERAINLSILAMSQPGKFSRIELNYATSSTPGGAHPSHAWFSCQRMICAACLDPAFLKIPVYRKINDRKKFGRKSNSTHAAYLFDGAWFPTHPKFIVYFRSCSMKTSLANDFAVVRLETKEGTFYYRNISGEEFIFYDVFNKFQKPFFKILLKELNPLFLEHDSKNWANLFEHDSKNWTLFSIWFR